MKRITIWYKYGWDNVINEMGFIHNHIENGWIEDRIPQPLDESFKIQKAWYSDSWKKRFGYLENGIVKVFEIDEAIEMIKKMALVINK